MRRVFSGNRFRLTLGLIVSLIAALVVLSYWDRLLAILHPGAATSILVLEDCDPNFKTPPFYDGVVGYTRIGSPTTKFSGFNICETVGGCRSLAVAPGSRFVVVCQNVKHELSAFHLDSGKPLWSLSGAFTASFPLTNGMLYALSAGDAPGTIYGKELLLISSGGQILKTSSIGGFDLASDKQGKNIWVVGKTIKQCDSDFNLIRELDCIGWCAVSVDMARDGSAWVAEREHQDVKGSTNRLVQISSEGKIIRSVGLPFSPLCVRIDHADDTLWVTGVASVKSSSRKALDWLEKRTGRVPMPKRLRERLTDSTTWSRTFKYDQRGNLLCQIRRGGFSLDVDEMNGSIWIGAKDKLCHYSREGAALGAYTGMTSDQKYVVVVPTLPK